MMPEIRVEGINVFYRDEGTGPGVLLGHSSTGSGGQWRSLLTRLSQRYRLIAPDHLGYGRTGAYTGMLPLAKHELAILNALIEILDGSAHLVGHSYGGALAARCAVRAPDRVRSLTLVEPTLFYLLAPAGKNSEHSEIRAVADRVIEYVDAGDPLEAARGFIAYWTSPGAFEAMDERTRAAVLAGMPKLRAEWPDAFVGYGACRDALARLTMPIQLIAGSETTPASRAVMGILRAIWPKASYKQVDGAGHMVAVTHAQEVNALIESFLDGLEAR
jgi:pimeloyl-ACP methyl ester carboxylesterase